MYKKLLSLLLILCMAAAVLAGCGNGGNNQAPSSGADTEPSQEEAGKPAESGNSGEKVTLKVFAFVPTHKEIAEKMAADYEAETGVHIDWEITGEDSYTVLKTRFASGESPDIFDLVSGDFSAWGEKCLSLNDEPFVDHLTPTVKDTMAVDGDLLGMPYLVEGNGIVYNKDIFEQAGIDKVPTTRDEYEEVCQKLEAAGFKACAEAWKDWGFLQHVFGIQFAYDANAEETCNKLMNGEMKVAELPLLDDFFAFFDLTLKYGNGAESIGYGYNEQLPDFTAGNIAMMKQGTWMAAPIKAGDPEMNIGLFAMPLTNDPTETKLAVAPTRSLCISNESKNPEEAKKFLNWIYENMQTYLVDGVDFCVPYDTVDSSNLDPLNRDMIAYMESDQIYAIFGHEYWPSGFNTDIQQPLQSYCAGVTDKEATIELLQEAFDSRAKLR